MYCSVYNLLSRLKNNQTKLRFLKYLENVNAVDQSFGLAYQRGVFKIVPIY